MRVSIWQEWASNHSGLFWVVGTFETVDAARNAYAEIRDMLFEIDKWHREHQEESSAAVLKGHVGLLPPEREFAQKYKVSWPITIDWTGWADYYRKGYDEKFTDLDAQKRASDLINEAVSIVGRNVIVHNPDQTWMTTQPFEGILSRLGAETIGYDFEFMESGAGKDFWFFPRMTFTAPNAATANQIEGAIRTYLSGALADAANPPPWNRDAENYAQVLPHSNLLKQEYLDVLTQVWQEKYNLSIRVSSLPHAVMAAKRLALREHNLKMERNGLNFTLEDLWFHNEELGVSALIAWLEVNRCTNIDFRYVRSPAE